MIYCVYKQEGVIQMYQVELNNNGKFWALVYMVNSEGGLSFNRLVDEDNNWKEFDTKRKAVWAAKKYYEKHPVDLDEYFD